MVTLFSKTKTSIDKEVLGQKKIALCKQKYKKNIFFMVNKEFKTTAEKIKEKSVQKVEQN